MIPAARSAQKPSPIEVHSQIREMLGKSTGSFVRELWALLADAQSQPTGVPMALVEEKRRQVEAQQAKAASDAAALRSVIAIPSTTMAGAMAAMAAGQTAGQAGAPPSIALQAAIARARLAAAAMSAVPPSTAPAEATAAVASGSAAPAAAGPASAGAGEREGSGSPAREGDRGGDRRRSGRDPPGGIDAAATWEAGPPRQATAGRWGRRRGRSASPGGADSPASPRGRRWGARDEDRRQAERRSADEDDDDLFSADRGARGQRAQ